MMKKILITGSAGLIGSESARFFAARGYQIVGIDNDMRATFFGAEASTRWNLEGLVKDLNGRYCHHDVDIRNQAALEDIFKSLGPDLRAIITPPRNLRTIGRREMSIQISPSTLTAP
jgi:CDP-paratose 2-epimerase